MKEERVDKLQKVVNLVLKERRKRPVEKELTGKTKSKTSKTNNGNIDTFLYNQEFCAFVTKANISN